MMSVSYDRVCRLCLSSKGDLQPIFSRSSSEETEPPALAAKILKCVSVQIQADDELPTQLCGKCVDNVNNWHQFKSICDKSQTKLLKLQRKDSSDGSKNSPAVSGSLSDEEYSAIDGNYPDYEQDSENVTTRGPPILASLGLAPKNSKGKAIIPEDDEEEEDGEDLGEPVHFPSSTPKVPNMPEVSITVMRPSGPIKAQPDILQLASKDCLVCGKQYGYTHNARRHEISMHHFDRYTNKMKDETKKKKPKLMPNPFNPKNRMIQHPPIPIKPAVPTNTHQLRSLAPFPLKIKSLSDLQTRSKDHRKEPEILKTLLTARAERIVSEPKLINSGPESPETLISEPELSSFQCETILTEPDTYGPGDDEEEGAEHELEEGMAHDAEEQASQSGAALVEMESDNEMEITTGLIPNESVKTEHSLHHSEDEENEEENETMEDEDIDKSQDGDEADNDLSQPDGELDDELDDGDIKFAPIVEINEVDPTVSDMKQDDDEKDDESRDLAEDEGGEECEDKTLEEDEPQPEEHDPNKLYVTKSQKEFIAKYRDIIEQVNTKTCHCCNKEYPRRKAVIQHLQKNGHKVPKHTCYNCVITFGQIGALLSHMRSKTCTDLWKIIYSEEGITDDMVTNDYVPPPSIRVQYKDILNARSYSCNLCPAKYQLKQLITKHVQEYHEDSRTYMIPLTCVFCGVRFKEQRLWKRHIRNAECTVNISCDMCREKFRTVQEFNDHAITVHAGGYVDQSTENQTKCVDDRPTDCPMCQKPHTTYLHLVKHLKNFHDQENPHFCHHCDEKFPQINNLYDHIYAKHSDKSGAQKADLSIVKEEAEEYHYSCTECNAIFETVDAWTDHQVAEHGQIAHPCDKCQKKFLRLSELEEHKSTHLKIRFYSCSVCSNSYPSPEKLSVHVVTTHPEIAAISTTPDSQFYCALCARSFKSRQAYSNHMRIHSKTPSTNRKPGDPYKPEVKQKQYPALPQNYVPVRQSPSLPNAPYFCDICGKGFMHKKNIWKHKKVLHSDLIGGDKKSNYTQNNRDETGTQASTEDEYNGEENGLGLSIPTFDNFNDLMNQQMFKCDQCPKQFPNNSNLLKHVKMKHINPRNMHNNGPVPPPSDDGNGTGGRSTCTICKINFADKKSYYRHRKNVHKANVQMCKICSKPLSSTLELYEHLKAAHARELLGYNAAPAKEQQRKRIMIEEIDEDRPEFHAKYPCNGCGKHFVGMLALQNHQCAQDILRETYDCEICHKSYTSLSALKSHRGWHLRSPDGKAAANNSGLWMPQNKVTSKISKHEVLEPMPRYNEEVAHAAVKRKLPPEVEVTVVNPHKKMRSDDSADDGSFERGETSQGIQGDDRYCGICDKEFTKRAAYQRHMDEVHQPNSVFCPVCDKSFTRKSTLLIHMRKHYDGGEPDSSTTNVDDAFHCDLCGGQFRSAIAVRMHKARHHGEQEQEQESDHTIQPREMEPRDNGHQQQQGQHSNQQQSSQGAFTCKQCGDGVASPWDLVAHRNWHATASKFYCHICKVYFPRALDLSQHTRIRHSDNEKVYFPCAMCDRFYMNKKSLQRHIEMAH